MKNIFVSDIMTRNPVVISPEADLLNCSKRMIKKKVGSLILVDKKKVVGFLSMRDILWALVKKSKEDLSKIKAIDISPRRIATIKPSVPIKLAFDKMKNFKFERLPVIHEGELIGIITIKDILSFSPEFYPELEEAREIREEAKKLKRVEKAKHRDFMHDGICEECGNRDILSRFNGMLICESCKNMR